MLLFTHCPANNTRQVKSVGSVTGYVIIGAFVVVAIQKNR